MAVAVNDAGDVLTLGQDGAWTPAARARNPDTGAEVYHDGQDWKPMPGTQTQQPGAAGAERQEGGPMRSLGLGARAAASGVLGLGASLYDAAAIPQNLVNAGVKAATGRDLGLSARSGGEHLNAGMDAVGLPQPETLGERRAARLIEGMAGAAPTMGAGAVIQAAKPVSAMAQGLARMLTGSPVVQVASGAGAGAAAQVADEAGAGTLGQMAAGLGGGGVAGMAGHAIGTGGRMLGALAMPFVQRGREAIVGNALLQGSADPANLQGRLMAAKLDPALRLPDSPVTTAQAARDPGLAMMESGMRSDMEVAPGSISPAARFAGMDTQRNAARTAEMPPPAPEAAATQGNAMRGVLEDAKTARAGRTAAAYDAVDPDNASRIPLGGVQQAMDDLSGRLYGPMSGGLPRDLQEVARDLRNSDLVPYSQVQALHGRITKLQNDFGADPRAQSLLIGLKQSLDDAAERAAQPQQPPSVPATQADLARQAGLEGAAQRPDVAEALRTMQGSRAEQQRTSTPESLRVAANRDGTLSGAAVGAGGRDESLASFLVRHGGVQDDGGELMQTLGGTTRTRPGLLSSRGLPLDRARELAHEAGYIGKPGQDINGAFGSTMDDLVQALDAELNAARPKPRMARLEEQVGQELDQRGLGVSLTDPPDQVLSAVRDPGLDTPAGAPAPDGYAPVPNAFTPEQAAAWREAQTLRRTQGRDFGRDETGTGAVPTILQRGQGGGFNAPDQQVVSHALSSPNAARQVLRAAGDEALPGLRQAFMDRAHGAASTGVADGAGNPMLREPGWRRFWQANRDTAAVIFPPDQLQRLNLLASDFAETATAQAIGKARGSDTARNLSVANMISMASRGLVDPTNPAMQSLLHPLGLVMSFNEKAIKQLLTDAMVDPELATRLLAKASPQAVSHAAGYLQQSMGQRMGQAAGNAGGRLAIRTEQAAGTDPEQQRRAAMAERLTVPPAASSQGRQQAMARRMMAPMTSNGP